MVRGLVKEANSKNSLIVQKIYEVVKQRIVERAKKGEKCLVYPFDGIDKEGNDRNGMRAYYDKISEDKKTTVIGMFTDNGFKWVYKASQDPGSPGDRPLEEFRW